MADRTPDDIEREIEEERAALTRSLGALQRELSPEVLIDKATALLRRQGGDAAGSAFRQARQNPFAVALTGAGLAWLAAGPLQTSKRPLRLPPPAEPGIPVRRIAAQPAYDHRSYPKAHGLRDAADPMAGFDERLARASGDITDPTLKQRFGDAVATAKENLMSVKSKLADAANDPKAAAHDLRTYLTEGTENFTEATRERVIAARQAAWDAERRIEARARDYAATGRDYYGQQPLVGGLVAFGLGALIGAALPRTRQEDRYLGSYRDRAVDEAERFYNAEAAKLRAVADTAVEDAKRMARETLNDVKADVKDQKVGSGLN